MVMVVMAMMVVMMVMVVMVECLVWMKNIWTSSWLTADKEMYQNYFNLDYFIVCMSYVQEFEHVILESALENVVNKFRRHITIKVRGNDQKNYEQIDFQWN